jgi:hypothetical protein
MKATEDIFAEVLKDVKAEDSDNASDPMDALIQDIFTDKTQSTKVKKPAVPLLSHKKLPKLIAVGDRKLTAKERKALREEHKSNEQTILEIISNPKSGEPLKSQPLKKRDKKLIEKQELTPVKVAQESESEDIASIADSKSAAK